MIEKLRERHVSTPHKFDVLHQVVEELNVGIPRELILDELEQLIQGKRAGDCVEFLDGCVKIQVFRRKNEGTVSRFLLFIGQVSPEMAHPDISSKEELEQKLAEIKEEDLIFQC